MGVSKPCAEHQWCKWPLYVRYYFPLCIVFLIWAAKKRNTALASKAHIVYQPLSLLTQKFATRMGKQLYRGQSRQGMELPFRCTQLLLARSAVTLTLILGKSALFQWRKKKKGRKAQCRRNKGSVLCLTQAGMFLGEHILPKWFVCQEGSAHNDMV